MRLTAEPAFVLHTRPWRETSLLVEVLSLDNGRLGLIARGVRGPKRQVLRAALQPLQLIRFDAVQQGELARLTAAEALDAAPRLQGRAMLAGFYINELCLRLTPRGDAQPDLFDAYAATRERLRAMEPLAWTLRRFERDLLDALGSGFQWHCDGDGEPIDATAHYRVDPEHGPRRVHGDAGFGQRSGAAAGRALLDLAADRLPASEDLPGLRRVLRGVLSHHLGTRGLKSWEMLAGLSAGAPPSQPDSPAPIGASDAGQPPHSSRARVSSPGPDPEPPS
ncbi:MAG: DNA repair protein RecO [Lysobacter sp.]|nr:DNA repair protein RecO [Lysobacter sp.]MDQ3269156.1 DNA repair protein RecO [Pseudomonadota bacterium]